MIPMATVLFTNFKKFLVSVFKLTVANTNSCFACRFVYIQLHFSTCPLTAMVVANQYLFTRQLLENDFLYILKNVMLFSLMK
jgi:hypothetical protein